MIARCCVWLRRNVSALHYRTGDREGRPYDVLVAFWSYIIGSELELIFEIGFFHCVGEGESEYEEDGKLADGYAGSDEQKVGEVEAPIIVEEKR